MPALPTVARGHETFKCGFFSELTHAAVCEVQAQRPGQSGGGTMRNHTQLTEHSLHQSLIKLVHSV
eukprot:5670801-Amphidinium_carterae.1